MSTWQLQEAKSRFSELVKVAELDGPQEITVHGRPVAVILSRQDYDRLSGTARPLTRFMQASPLFGLDELDLERDQSLTRDITL